MTTLNRFPRGVLRLIHLLLFVREPADGCRVEQKLGAAERRQPGRFRKPLVPTDKRADLAVGGVMRLKAEIAWREIKLLVVKRIVWDMHLAILARDLAGRVDHHGRVVIHTRGAFFEERGDDDDLLLTRYFAESFR